VTKAIWPTSFLVHFFTSYNIFPPQNRKMFLLLTRQPTYESQTYGEHERASFFLYYLLRGVIQMLYPPLTLTQQSQSVIFPSPLYQMSNKIPTHSLSLSLSSTTRAFTARRNTPNSDIIINSILLSHSSYTHIPTLHSFISPY